jgi:hypothetical protein
MHQLAVPAVQQVKEEDIDRRPKWETARPTMKKEWSSSITSMKRKASVLTEADESALFRASQFPFSLFHVEADLKGKKALQGRHSTDECGGRLSPGVRPMWRVGLLVARECIFSYVLPS